MPKGIATQGDIALHTIDGVPVEGVWTDLTESLRQWNDSRSAIAALFTFQTTRAGDIVPQLLSSSDAFEEASEFGLPKATRGPDTLLMGYDRKDYDARTEYTSRFIRDATADQINATHDLVLAGDNELLFAKIMSAIFRNSQRTNDENLPVYPLWNGDGMTPPPVLGRVFDSSHTHYTTSGAASVDSGDVEALLDQVSEHGYGLGPGSKLIVLVNPQEGKIIRKFRANVVNQNGQTANYDFIPSEGAPTYLTDKQIVGSVAPAQYANLDIIGSYGPAFIAEEPLIPSGYFVVVGTSGPGSANNPVGFREHPNAAERGLKIIPGPNPSYPLNWATYTRCMGTGVRHRGAAAVMQITASSNYAVPAVFA